MGTSIIGTCEAMCPKDEIQLRIRERLLHFFERKQTARGDYVVDESRVVKEFARSAAGVRAPKPYHLRTKSCLKRTVTYLLTDIIGDERKPFNVAYDFIFDRLRAIRQEIVMQDFDECTTIELIEPMIMFLAYSLYRLAEEPIDRFDPKICRQHLQESLKKVLRCYDSLDEPIGDGVEQIDRASATKHREFIESLYLLFNLGSNEALRRAVNVPKKFRNSTFETAFTIALSFWNGNLYKCLLKITKLPFILCAVASLHVQSIRRDLLQIFSVAYQSKVLTVPLPWLKQMMFYNSVQELRFDCQYYGVNIDPQTNTSKFQRDSFLAAKPTLQSRGENFVNSQLDSPIEDILLFKCID